MKIKEFIVLNISLFLLAFVIINCLSPAKLAAGGTTGIALILSYYNILSVDIAFFVLNFPLIILSWYIFGKKYLFTTLYCILLITLYLSSVSKYLEIKYFVQIFSNYKFLASIVGGILTGITIGMIMKLKGNTGGTSIIAQIIEKYFKIKVGTTINTIDISIVLLSLFLISLNSALLTILSLYICGVMINQVNYNKGI
ncbi:MAG: YitT family protein [Campylobacteraceae bacterium]